LVVAALCLLAASLGAYGAYAVLDEDAFADRATGALLESDELREELGDRVATRLMATHLELSPLQPMIEVAAVAVAVDPAFQAAFDDGARRLHHALFSDPDAPAAMVVTGSSALVRTDLEYRGIDAPPIEDVALFTVRDQGREGLLRSVAPVAADLAVPLSIGFAFLGLALLGLAVARERHHRRAVWAAGLTVALAAGLTAASVTAAEDAVLERFDTGFGDAVVDSVWDAYLADLRLWALVACAAALVVAAAAGGPRPSIGRLLAAPATLRCRLLRAVGLLAVAWLAVRFPELVLHTGLIAVAAGLLYVAAGDLLRGRGRQVRREAELAQQRRGVPVGGALDHEAVVVEGGDDGGVGLGPAAGRRDAEQLPAVRAGDRELLGQPRLGER
jgi:hypothetical protein